MPMPALITCVCLTLALIPAPVTAQEVDAVAAGAAGYAPTLYAGKRLALDPGLQGFAFSGIPTARTSEELAHLAGLAGALPVTREPVRFCPSDPGDGCVDELVRIGVPEVRGDSATVWLYARHQWRATGPPSETRTSHHDAKLLLTREGTRWRVVGVLERRVE